MENQNQNSVSLSDDDGQGAQSPFEGAVVKAPDTYDPNSLSFDQVVTPQQVYAKIEKTPKGKGTRFLQLLTKRADLLLAALLIFGVIGVLASTTTKGTKNKAATPVVNSQYETQNLPLDDFSLGTEGIDFGNSSVVINGALVITPTLQPSSPTPGQLYYDQETNIMSYYNGTTFLSLGGNQQDVVETLGGISGQVSLGGGLGIVDDQLVNAGVLSVGGETGAIVLGNGLNMNGNVLQNTGVLNLVAGTSNVTITDNGDGEVSVSVVGAGTGTVASGGGTVGAIPVFTGAQNIEDSIVTQGGGTITVAGDLDVTGALSLGTDLSVANGGTGASSLTANGVIVGNGAAALTSVAAGAPGLCLISTAGAPTWGACAGGGGVTSLNGLTGALSIANASGVGSTVTIDNATTATKGIASFNATNFSVAGGAVNTIQNINTGATPTFAGVNTNSVTPSAALTVGAIAQTLSLQGSTTTITSNGGGNIVLNSANTIELQDNTNVTGNLDVSGTLTSGTGNAFQVDASGNVSAGTYNGQTISAVASFTGSVTVATGLTVAGGNLAVNAGNITASGNATLQGGTITAGSVTQQGSLVLHDGNGQTATVSVGSALGASTALAIPTAVGVSDTFCLQTLANCSGTAVTLQSAYDNTAGGTPEIVLDATRAAVTVRDNATPIGGNLFEVQNNGGGTTYFAVSASGTTVTQGFTVTGTTNVNTSGTAATSVGNGTGTLTLTGGGSSTFVVNGVTVDATEFNRLDGKDAALVDTNDAVNTAITGTGALGSGSITSGFGSIDTGADNITTTGTLQGTTSVLTQSLDRTSAGALNIGASTATSIVLGQNTSVSGTSTFTSGTGTVLLQGNTDIAAGVSLATKRAATYTTAGSADDVALNVASLYILDTSGAAQTITGIAAGRDGQRLTLVNADAALSVTLSNNSGSSAAANRISTGTGLDITILAGGSVELVYDTSASLWRVVGSVAGGSGTCASCANQQLSNLSSTDINAALNATSANLSLTTTTSGNIVLNSAGTIELQDNTNVTGTLGVSSTLTVTTGGLTVSAGGASIAGNTTIATTGGNTLGLGNATGALTVTGNSSSTFVLNGVTVDATEFNRLDGKDAALVDTNDAVNTAITGTGALNTGSITSGFGSIDTGADNITTTGTVQGTSSVLTQSLDRTSAGALNIGASTATSILLGQNTSLNGTSTFTSGTGTVLLQGNTDIGAAVSLATKRAATYTTAGSADDVALNGASLYILDTSGAAQTITGIAAGRDGQHLTLVNADAALAVTLSNNSGSSAAANRITTGTGADVSLPAGASISLIYDTSSNLWRVIAGSSATCVTCANQQLSNLSSVNINTALNATSANLSLTTTTSGNIVLNSAGTIELQDNTNVTGNVDVSGTLVAGTGDAFQVDASGNITGGTYNTNTFSSSNLQFGAAATATIQSAASQALTITGNAASTWSTSTGNLTVQAASSLNLKATSGNVVLGTSDTTGTLLVVDIKTDAGDPAGTDGAIYYNSNIGSFRCFQGAWTNCITASGGFVSLQNAYDNGNTITTDSSGDIAFTLNNQNFTVTTAAGATGSTTFSLADGANTSPAAQLVLIDNADVNQALANGLTITSAAGTITDGLDVSDAEIDNAINVGANTILGTAAAIDLTNFDVSTSGAITSASNATLQGGSLTLGTTSQAGSVVISDGSSNTGTLQVAALGQNTVYTLPDPGSGTVSICLTTGNCAGAGGGITGSGTNNRITKFTGGSTVGDSTISDNGSVVTTSADLVIQGGDATIGVSNTQTGTLNFADAGSAFLGSIVQAGLGGDRTYTLPDASGDFCLSSGNCLGGGGGGANTALSNLASVNINTALNATSANLSLTTTTSGNIVLNSAGTIELQDNTNVTGTLGVSSTLTVTAGGASIAGNTTIATTAGNTLGLGNSTGALTLTGNSSSTFVLNAVTVDATEFNRLDGKDAALVDTNDAVNTAITGTGALGSGSITSGFGSIDTGADNITTTGTLQGTTSVLTQSLDRTSAGALNIGTTTATSILLGQNTSLSGTSTFTSGTGTVLLQGNTDVAAGVSFATKRGATYTTAGSADDVALNVASLYILDTSGAAQTITGIVAGRDGQHVTLVNGDAALAVTLSNNGGSSAAANRITTGTGSDISVPAGASVTLVYDTTSSLWRLVGGVAGGAGTCPTCANQQLSNLSSTNINTALNATSGNLSLTTTTSGNIVLNSAGTIELQDNTNVTGTLGVSSTLTVTAGGASIAGNTTIATTAGNTLGLGNSTGALTVTGNSSSTFVLNAVTVDATEFNRLDGKDAALVDTNDTVNTAITGTGALGSGSITSGFGSIDTGADNITTTGTLQGTTSVLTQSLDRTSAGALNIGTTTATSILLGQNTSLSGTSTFTSGTGTVLLQGNTDVAAGVSLATKRGATYTTAGSADDVAISTASLYLLDTSGAAQTITGIAAGRDGQYLTLVNADAALAVTLSNNNGSSAAANRITTGTGADISISAGGSVTLIYDSASALWRVVGGVAGGAGTCAGCANTSLSNLSSTNINTALNATSGNLSLTTTTSGNIVLNSAGTIELQDNTNVTGTLGVSSTLTVTTGGLTVSAGGASIAGSTTIATTAGNTLGLGNTTGAVTVTGNSSSTFVLNAVTVDATEFNRLDGKDAALVDANDAVNTAITGTGALGSGSISSGFGAIDTGADNITTTGTLQGTTSVLTQSLDRTSAGALNIGATTATSILLGQNTSLNGTSTFTSGTGTVLLQGNTDIAAGVSLATKRAATYTTAGSADDVALNVASLYILDTSGAAQTITGIAAGRDGQHLTLINGDAALAVTLSNNSGSSAAANRITTGTGADISLAAGAGVDLVYDTASSLWRVIGGTAGGSGTCPTCANQQLSNLSSTNINAALNATSGNLSLTTTTSGNIVLNSAGTIELQDNTNVTGTLGVSSTLTVTTGGLTVSAGGASIAGNTSIATTAGNTLGLGNSTGALTVTGNSSSTFVLNAVTVDATEFNRLDGKDAALVDTNDAVNTAITGTGALGSGSISSGFGSIDTGADNITTTGTLQGTTSVLTQSLDRTSAGALNIGTTTATSILLGQNTSLSGASTFTSGTGTVLLQGNTDVAAGVSFATKRAATYTTAGSADDVALNVASLYILDTSGAAQTITGIAAGRDGQHLTLINGDAALAVTLSNNGGSSAAANRITTGTGSDISLAAGASVDLIYDTASSLWRVVGSVAGGSGSCPTCANQQLSNLSSTNINTALNATSGNLSLTTTTSGNIVLNSAGTIELQDNTNVTGTLGVSSTLTVTTGGLTVSAGGASIAGNTTIATTGGNTLGLGNATGAVTVTGNSSSTFVLNAVTIDATEFNRLDGKDAALVDTNDAVNTAITGTGALGSGSISSGFGSIDTGADNITTTGTVQGTASVLTQSLDRTSAGALNIGTTTATSILLGQNTSLSGTSTFTSGTGTVLLQGNTDIGAGVSFATKRAATYTTAGSADDVALNVASLYILDTSGAAQTITGIAAGRDGQHLTLINGDAALAVTLSNNGGSSAAANRITTGTGADVSLAAGASVDLIYDTASSLWRVVGGVAGGTCATCANQQLSNLSSTNINTALNATSGNLSLTTTTSGNIVLNSAGTIELQDNTNVTGTLGVSSTLTVTAGGASIAGSTTIATTAGNTLGLGNSTGALTVTGNSSSTFVLNAVTIDATEFNRLDGKDAALVDTNDAVNTAITGTGALDAGSITAGFGSIDTGGDNITTTGTLQGTTSVLTQSLDRTSAGALNIGTTTATSILLGQNTSLSGTSTFTSGTGTVLLQGNTDIAAGVSLATKRAATYTTAGSANDVALNVASLYILDTSGAAQTITGIAAGRDGQQLTLVNADAALAVTLSNNSGSSSANNRISTGTGGDITLPAGASISLIYDTSSNLWRAIAGSSATCTTCANQQLSNLSSTNINAALNATSGNLSLTTTTSGNIVLNSAGTIELQDNTNVTGTLGVSSTLTVTAGGASIAGNTTIATTAGNTLGLGNSTGALTVTGNSSSTFVLNAVTIDATEFNRLDGKDAALVDTNDAVATAIIGTGALDSGSITSGFGSIDTGADNITTTGTVQGTASVLTQSLDRTSAGALNIGTTTATSILLGQNTSLSGTSTFTSGTGTVLLQGNTDIAAGVSLATKRGATYTTAGSANDVALNVASLYVLDTSGAAQTITGIAAGRDGQHLTLINGDAALAVTLSNLSGSSAAANQISTGTGGDITMPAGASLSLVYDTSSSLWRVISGSSATCATCANQQLSNLSSTNINTALNATSGNLSLTTTTSGNIVLNSAGTIELQDNTNVTGTLGVSSTLTVTAGGASIAGNTTIATTGGNTLGLGNATGALTVTGNSSSTFVLNAITVDATEFNRLDGKDAALVDTNDAVNTAITGTGALGSGSITSGFGAIDVGADNITTTGTVFGNDFDRTAAGALTLGNTNATSLSLCNSAACDTIDIGINTDGDAITIGDNTDTFALNSTGLRISTAGSLTNVGANITGAGALTVASTGATALNFTGGATSTWDVNGTLQLQTTNNGAITTGTGLATLNGGTVTAKTLTANSGGTQNVASITFTSPADSSGTNVSQGLNITPTIGNATAGTNTANIINIGAVTGDDLVTLNAINIGALTGTAATETAINIGAGWDNAINANGTLITLAELGVLDNGIELGDLTTQGAATDEFCLTSETGGGALLAWQSCGAAGANTALSNLASVAINTDLQFDNTGNRTMNIAATGAGVAGRNLTLQAGASGTGAVNGGNLVLQAGATGGAGSNGQVQIGTANTLSVLLGAAGATKATVDANSVTLATGIDLTLQGANAFISNTQAATASEIFGNNATASGTNVVVIGNGAGSSTFDDVVIIGQGASTAGSDGIAIGNGTNCISNACVAIGGDAASAALGAIAVGYSANATFGSSIALGADAQTTATNQFVVGSDGDPITQVVFGSGVSDTASLSSVVLQATSAITTSNLAGADFTLAGGQGTGSAAGGSIIFRTSAAGGAGAGVNSLATLGTFSSTSLTLGNTTLNTAVTLQSGTSNINLNTAGTGDVVVTQAAGSNLQITASAAPTFDQVIISNSGQASATNGVDGLQVTFGSSNASGDALHITPTYAGGATDALTYNIFEADAFSPTNGAGTDTINGIKIGALTEGADAARLTSTAINIGSGWDTGINLSNSIITNIGNASTDFNTNGGLTLAENLTVQGTTGITFSTGAGGDITFANGEKIDNDTNAQINLQADSGAALTLLLTGTAATVTNSAGTLTLDSFNNTLTVAASDTTLTSAFTTVTLGSNTSINSAGTITLDSGSNVIIPSADTLQSDDLTSTGALTLGTASNGAINLNPNGTGDIVATLGNDSQFLINATPTADTSQDSFKLTLNPTITGSTGTLQGLVISQSDNANNGVYDSLVKIENLKTPETTTNGLYIQQNAASGTLTNGIQVQQSAGTLSNGIQFAGTLTNGIYFASASTTADIRKDTTGFTLDLNNASNSTLTVTNAGAGVASVSVEAGGSYTSAGTLTVSSGGSSGLSLDSASGRVTVATGDFLSLSVAGVSGAAAGDIWYDSSAGKFKINEAGSTKILCNLTDTGCGAGGTTPDFDAVYAQSITNGNLTMEIDDTGGLIFNMTTTGDFKIQDNGSDAFTVDDAGNVLISLDTVDDSTLAVTNNGDADILFELFGNGGFAVTDSGVNSLAVTALGVVELGAASGANGVAQFNNSTNSNWAKIQAGVTSGNYTLTLPTALPGSTQCLQSTSGGALSFTACSGSPITLQDAYNNASSPASIVLSSTKNGLFVQNPASSGTTSGYTLLVDQLNTGAVDALKVSQVGTGAGTTANFISANTSGTQTNGILFNRNASSGTTTNGINITQTAGTLTNGLAFTGTITNDIFRAMDVLGGGTLTMTGGTGTAGSTGLAGVGMTLQGGNGGSGSSGSGGSGGAVQITAGAGNTGSSNGGVAGTIDLQAGNGGQGTSTTGRAGGNITLTAGNGGTGGVTNGAAGNIVLKVGNSAVGSVPGFVNIQNSAGTTLARFNPDSTTAGATLFNLNSSSTIEVFSVRNMSTNFGSLAKAGAFESRNSYWGEEFNSMHNGACSYTNAVSGTPVNQYARGDYGNVGSATTCANTSTLIGGGELNLSSAAGTAAAGGCTAAGVNTANGIERLSAVGSATANSSTSCVENLAASTTTSNKIYLAGNLPVMTLKLKASTLTASDNNERVIVGMVSANTATALGTNSPVQSIYFTNCSTWNNAAAPTGCSNSTWYGVTSAATAATVVTCSTGSGSITGNYAYMRIEVRSITDVHFFVDYNTSDGISESECGSGSSTNITGSGMTPWLETQHLTNTATNTVLDIDYIRSWQDDNIVPENIEETAPNGDATLSEPPIVLDSTTAEDPHAFFSFLGATSEDTVFEHDVYVKGTLFADKIKANQIEGLELFTDKIASLQEQLALERTPGTGRNEESDADESQTSAASGDLELVVYSLNIGSGIVVGGPAEFHGNAFFYKLVTFTEKTVFKNDITLSGHVATSGESLAVQLESAAGVAEGAPNSSGAVLAAATVDGNDVSGQFTLNIGDNAGAGAVLTLKFKNPYAKAPHILLTPGNDKAGQAQYYVQSSTDGFKLFLINPPAPGTSLQFNYWASETGVTQSTP